MNVTVSSRGKYRRQPGVIAVNVARPSRWGNRFIVGRDGTLEECVAQYKAQPHFPQLVEELREHIARRRTREKLPQDAPVVLLCGSEHRPCHAETLTAALRNF